MYERPSPYKVEVEEEVVFVSTKEEIEELEKEGYHIVTDSEHFAGGEV